MDPKKAVSLLALVFVAGCATVVKPHVTPLAFSSDTMEIVGPAEGESTEHLALGVVWSEDNIASVIKATKSALEAAKADAILNPTVQEQRDVFFFGLFGSKSIKVYGMAVRFKKKG